MSAVNKMVLVIVCAAAVAVSAVFVGDRYFFPPATPVESVGFHVGTPRGPARSASLARGSSRKERSDPERAPAERVLLECVRVGNCRLGSNGHEIYVVQPRGHMFPSSQ